MLLDTWRDLRRAVETRSPAAYCRLVETRGSTPQKAGALMLVYPNGTQSGTLGGGCVEAEVKRRALAVIESGQRAFSTFQLDSDYGWDDGLICGGRMRVLIEPLGVEPPGGEPRANDPPGRSAAANARDDYFRALAATHESGAGHTEAVVMGDDPSEGPSGGNALVGACALFADDGALLASTSRDPSLADLATALRPLEERPRPYTRDGVSYLPFYPRCRLVIVGGGHVGQAVGALAVDLDFDVWVVDDRDTYVSSERFPRAQRRIVGPIESVLADLEITPGTYCLIVTRGHQHDERALYHLANRGAAYVGLIGSRRKIKMIFRDLLAEGIPAEALRRVFAPVGLDIGSQTVPEIAVSIAAELVAHRNLRGEPPGRPEPVAVSDA